MIDYDLIKTAHIIFSTLFLGGGAVSAFFKFKARKVSDLNTLKYIHETIVTADYLFTLPAVIGLPLTGFWMLDFDPLTKLETWVELGIFLYLIAISCWVPAAILQIKMKNCIKKSIEDGSGLNENYYKYSKIWFLLGVPSVVATVFIFYVMVSKSSIII